MARILAEEKKLRFEAIGRDEKVAVVAKFSEDGVDVPPVLKAVSGVSCARVHPSKPEIFVGSSGPFPLQVLDKNGSAIGHGYQMSQEDVSMFPQLTNNRASCLAISSTGSLIALGNGKKLSVWLAPGAPICCSLPSDIYSLSFSCNELSPFLLARTSTTLSVVTVKEELPVFGLPRRHSLVVINSTVAGIFLLPSTGSAFSQDGYKFIVATSATIATWSISCAGFPPTPNLIEPARAPLPIVDAKVVVAFAFDQMQKKVVTALVDGAINVWNWEQGTKLKTVRDPSSTLSPSRPTSLAATRTNRDGEMILACGETSGAINLYSTTEGFLYQLAERHKSDVVSLDVDKSGATLVSAGSEGTVKIWTLSKVLNLFSASSGKALVSAAFGVEVALIAAADVDMNVDLWSLSSGSHVHTIALGDNWLSASTKQTVVELRYVSETKSFELRRGTRASQIPLSARFGKPADTSGLPQRACLIHNSKRNRFLCVNCLELCCTDCINQEGCTHIALEHRIADTESEAFTPMIRSHLKTFSLDLERALQLAQAVILHFEGLLEEQSEELSFKHENYLEELFELSESLILEGAVKSFETTFEWATYLETGQAFPLSFGEIARQQSTNGRGAQITATELQLAANPIPPLPQCPLHAERLLDYFCIQCNAVFCCRCAFNLQLAHLRHRVVEIDREEAFRSAVKSVLDDSQASFRDELASCEVEVQLMEEQLIEAQQRLADAHAAYLNSVTLTIESEIETSKWANLRFPQEMALWWSEA
jgi:WD40 repeat protein